MSAHGIRRRQFLKTSGGAAVVLSGGVTTLLTSRPALALDPNHLSRHQAETLLQMARQLYPHPDLADHYYKPVVEALDQQAGDDESLAELLASGVQRLDGALGILWLDLSPGYQLQVLQEMQADPFFQKVRGQTVFSLYNNRQTWRHFGYEGEAYTKGGYYQRGFDDLTWLPEPPEEASPKGWWEV